jgi:hypothetical protein
MNDVRYATENVVAEVDEEGGKVTRQVAVAGQPVPAAYDHLVPDSKTTKTPNESSPVATGAQRVRRPAGAADPDRSYGTTAEESGIAPSKSAGRKSGSK